MLNPINVKYWELIHDSESLGYHKVDDYNARCDVCGDSKTRKNLKRLHLYRKPSYDDDSIKCYNCGSNYTMYSYLRDNHPELLSSYSQEIGHNKLNSLLPKKDIIVTEVKKVNTLFTFDKHPELLPPDINVINYL